MKLDTGDTQPIYCKEGPCTLRFEGEVKDVVKLKKFMKPKLAEHKEQSGVYIGTDI